MGVALCCAYCAKPLVDSENAVSHVERCPSSPAFRLKQQLVEEVAARQLVTTERNEALIALRDLLISAARRDETECAAALLNARNLLMRFATVRP